MANYTGYEIKENDCVEDLEQLCSHLTQDGSFTTYTTPNTGDIYRWLTLSHHWIAGVLAGAGYSPTQSDEVVLGILEELNVLDTAIKIELANPVTGDGEPNERFKEFEARRKELLELITGTTALDNLGAVLLPTQTNSPTATGVSLSRKRNLTLDLDAVQPRFTRGFGLNSRAGDRSYGDVDLANTSDR